MKMKMIIIFTTIIILIAIMASRSGDDRNIRTFSRHDRSIDVYCHALTSLICPPTTTLPTFYSPFWR